MVFVCFCRVFCFVSFGAGASFASCRELQVLSQPGNLWRFWITVLFDQVKNAYVWFTLKASVYMVNVVFGHKDGVEDELLVTHDPEKTAEVIGLMSFGSMDSHKN